MSAPINALEGFWLAQEMKHSLWLYPVVETVHLWGIAALFGAIVLVDLRILGLAPQIDVARLARFAIPVAFVGFGLAVISGLMMFLAHASEFIDSTLFLLKMSLLCLLALNALSLHLRVQPTRQETAVTYSGSVKLQALISVVGWALVIGMGRWLAYV